MDTEICSLIFTYCLFSIEQSWHLLIIKDAVTLVQFWQNSIVNGVEIYEAPLKLKSLLTLISVGQQYICVIKLNKSYICFGYFFE